VAREGWGNDLKKKKGKIKTRQDLRSHFGVGLSRNPLGAIKGRGTKKLGGVDLGAKGGGVKRG